MVVHVSDGQVWRTIRGIICVMCAVGVIACSSSSCTSSQSHVDSTAPPTTLTQSSVSQRNGNGSAIAEERNLIDSAVGLGNKVSAGIGCIITTQAIGVLQSPYAVATVGCGDIADRGANLYVFAQPNQKTFALTVELASSPFAYLVGTNWVVIARPAKIKELKAKLGGQDFNESAVAIAQNPSPANMDKLTTCQQLTTGAVIDYVAYNSDAVQQVNVVLPGLNEYFASVLKPQVQNLASFNRGDAARAAVELIPFAPDFRVACQQLVK